MEDSVIRGPDILHTCIFYSIKFDKNVSVVKTVCTMLNRHNNTICTYWYHSMQQFEISCSLIFLQKTKFQ